MDNKLSNKIKFLACVSLLLIPLFVILIVYNGKLSGNDFWWHIKVGEWICTNKALPYEDIFSWYGMEIIFHGVLRNGYLMLYFT